MAHMTQDLRTMPASAAFVLRLKTVAGSRYFREPIILVVAYMAYYLARSIAGSAQPAFENARYLMTIENSIGLFEEISVQSALLSYETVVHIFNIIYFYGHWPTILAFAVFMFIKQPHVYSITRNAFLMSGAVALVFFVLFPVAPPRLATFGIVDTLSMTIPLKYDDSPLVNPYAALPSLHVGWALLISLGLLLATKKVWLRAIACTIAPAMLAATVITGNHFIVDGIFGAILCGITFLIALWLHKHWPEIDAIIKTWRRQARSLPV
jgi:membrane-associated phospholipid phosphatase